jgi:hypothetical protein
VQEGMQGFESVLFEAPKESPKPEESVIIGQINAWLEMSCKDRISW